jgi:hypothetical protein
MDIFNEILWSQFIQLNEVSSLPLNEQVKKYNQYLNELQYQRQCYIQQLNWLECNKGGKKKETLQNIGVLLQEDLFDLEQEDGSKIYITRYA